MSDEVFGEWLFPWDTGFPADLCLIPRFIFLLQKSLRHTQEYKTVDVLYWSPDPEMTSYYCFSMTAPSFAYYQFYLYNGGNGKFEGAAGHVSTVSFVDVLLQGRMWGLTGSVEGTRYLPEDD